MDVHGGIGRLAGQLAELLAKHFLKVICKLILGTEEDNTTLRDCRIVRLGFEGGTLYRK